MKITNFTVIALATFMSLQACKIPRLNSQTPEMPFTMVTLRSGTALQLAAFKSPSIRQIHTGTPINFKVIQDVVSDGKTVIPTNSMAIGSIIKIQANGSYNADIVTIRLESVTLSDGQEIPLVGKPFQVKVNLHDTDAALFKNGFSTSATVADDSTIRL